jgi:peroxiredoxin
MIPSLRGWNEIYEPQGLVVIANHYPEFDYENDLERLKQAVRDLNVTYPVAQDNEGTVWRAYHNRYWPTQYLIDKHGEIRYVHIGEGDEQKTEAVIQTLLAEQYP